MSWFDYLDALNEANSYRNRVKPKRLKRDMGKYGVDVMEDIILVIPAFKMDWTGVFEE